ncbi:MAG: CatB-related O-acetyltransferase [Dehalococcoidia bacterium]|nr:CatB-related O-acetyltransferase [Dehalococcoidia bacterium]
MLRNQYTSQTLRDYFAKNHGIVAGLYTYGCFDARRFRPGVTFGRYCSIADSVCIFTRNHPMDATSMHPMMYEPSLGLGETISLPFGQLKVEDDVWIGHNVTILPSVKFIGRGSVIGAGSVVTHDVPPYAIVAGNPVRLIKMRFDEKTIERIEKSQWWEMSVKELREFFKKNPDIFPFPMKIRSE